MPAVTGLPSPPGTLRGRLRPPESPTMLTPTRLAAVAALAFAAALPAQAADFALQRVWQYAHAATGVPGQKAEIVAHDARSDTLWVAGVVGVDVLDRASGQLVAHLDVSHLGAVNSVAIARGVAALAVENGQDRTLPGSVVLFDTRTRAQLGHPIPVGPLPDMLTFAPDGRTLLVANEGTPNPRPTPAGLSAEDPVGSVSIVDIVERSVTTLPITADIPGHDQLRLFPATGTRATQPASYSAYDPEPEYITVDASGRRAWVTLQEANGLALLDIQARRFVKIVGLGEKDFSLPGNGIDPNDRDPADPATNNGVFLRPVPVFGLYQPDSIASYRVRGRSYLVMANEGDARDNGSADGEDERRGSAGSSDAARLVPSTGPAELFRLTYDNVTSTPQHLVAFGARSISIRDADGRLVWDSGSLLDAEAIRLGVYDDGRSDNKGVEPEGVALLEVDGRTLAFVGLERTKKAAIAAFDVSEPTAPVYLGMVLGEGDVSPEGLHAFHARGRHYLAVAHESSDTTTLYEIAPKDGRRR